MTARNVGHVIRNAAMFALLVGVVTGSRYALVGVLVVLAARLELLSWIVRTGQPDATAAYLRGYADRAERRHNDQTGPVDAGTS